MPLTQQPPNLDKTEPALLFEAAKIRVIAMKDKNKELDQLLKGIDVPPCEI